MPFWPKSNKNDNTSNTSNTSNTDPSSSPPSSSPSSPPIPPSPSTKPSSSAQTYDDLADKDLRELLSALDTHHAEEEKSRAKAQRSSPFSGTSNSRYQPTTEEKNRFKNDTDFTTSFSTQMSCLDAFDRLWYCYSLGGQFLNVYRYGTLRDCSAESTDWRFCMKTKVYGPATRKAMIYTRNKEKAAKYKTNPSSEEVWTVRTEPVQQLFHGWSGDSPTPSTT